MTEEYDKGEHVKDTFAYFGRAYYMANVFEAGLAIAIMQLDFLEHEVVKLQREGRVGFDRAKYEADFDAFMDRQHAQTLGNLIKRAQSLAVMDADFLALLVEVKAKRDFLARHFFRERSVEFASRQGRDAMIAEIEVAHAVFERADRALDRLMVPHHDRIGLRDEKMKAAVEKFMRDAGAHENLD